MTEKGKSTGEAAKRLAKLGARKGGRARASVLTAEERSEVARNAARARWAKAGRRPRETTAESMPVPARAASTANEGPPYSMFRGALDFASVEMECHVLSDGRRVLTQREVVRVLSGGRDSSNLARYLSRNPLYRDETLENRIIRFKVPGKPQLAHGYEATMLVEICESYLDAREEGLLHPSQENLARVAETVIRACAKVGIIALIDEATGYQEVRQKNALRIKLQAFIAEDMQAWAKMFPDEFWFELARLEGTRYSPRSRPLRWGRYVMLFVYDAIDQDVGNRLRKINPNPHHRQNHHQWLKDFGRDKVNDQIQRVIAVMKLCENMHDFRRKFDRVFSKTVQLEIGGADWSELDVAA